MSTGLLNVMITWMEPRMDEKQYRDERRRSVRYHVDWFVSIMHKIEDGSEIYRDRLNDISLGGAGIYSDTDIYTDSPIVMLVETPLPHSYGNVSKVLAGIECSMCKPVFFEERQQFHIGVQFLRFHGIGKHLLAEALFKRNQAVAGDHQKAGHSLFM